MNPVALMKLLTVSLALASTSAHVFAPMRTPFDVFTSWGFDDAFPQLGGSHSAAYHRDVLDHFSRQYRCAHVCADRNRDIRRSSIANSKVHIQSDPTSSGVASHQVSVPLPGVDAADIKVQIVGDVLSIKASRTWTRDLIPEPKEDHQKCNCKDIAEEVLGKKDEFSTQFRISNSMAKDKVTVELRKDTDELVVTVPEKEPETINLSVREIEAQPRVEPPQGDKSKSASNKETVAEERQ
eukprot:CAMPEP_0167786690 /NCGR_PEP_ID=MMETSP0111_2-20121227/8960_1 /TAXON_ID=91324 /ORGANISM="Lotharella globosa, Strain CCCM811" /LENGTH=238 /DNA_ID=CAMNT_0007678155 /DNA_START=90 /DNA_END=806 /DNA_ORIENTATION=-